MQPRSENHRIEVLDMGQTSLWEILVPTCDNNGRSFSVRHHRQWDAFVVSITGGMTLHGPVKGTWVDAAGDGAAYVERMIPVRIACTREQIIEICKETARFYDQIEVLAYLIAQETVMVRNPGAVRDDAPTDGEQ